MIELNEIIKKLRNNYFKTILLGKIVWNEYAWQGYDPLSFENAKKGAIHDEFVKDTGFGHEWWNFYDFDESQYFYGFLKTIPLSEKFIKPALMVFVSKKNENEKLRIVGYYSDFDILFDSPIVNDLSQTGISDEILEQMKDGLKSHYNKKKLQKSLEDYLQECIYKVEYKLIVKKQNAMIFPSYHKFNIESDDIASVHQSYFRYISSSNTQLLIEKLEIWQEFIEKDTELYITPFEEHLSITPMSSKTIKINQRTNQQIFRRKVLRKDDNECKICGINDKNFLNAAHFINWKNNEIIGGDPYNGITLCLNHHKVFDLQKISFKPIEAPDEKGLVSKWKLSINSDLLKNTNLLENLKLTGKNNSTIRFKAKKEYVDKLNDQIYIY